MTETPLEREAQSCLFNIIISIGLIGLLLLGLLGIGGYVIFNRARRSSEQVAAVQTTTAVTVTTQATAVALTETPTPVLLPTDTSTVPPTNTPVVPPSEETPGVTPGVTPRAPIPELPATPEATPTPVSKGRLEVTYPLEMVIEEADIVTVEIIADRRLAETGIHPAYATGVIGIEISSQDGARGRIEDRIRLYPVMSAELTAGKFDITSGDVDARRVITTTYPAVWTWAIAATKPGMQRITINIFGEATIDEEKLTVLEMSKSRNINVVEKPLTERILNSLVNNFVAIVGAGGPLGLIITYLTRRANQADKKLKDKVESLGKKLKELEEVQLERELARQFGDAPSELKVPLDLALRAIRRERFSEALRELQRAQSLVDNKRDGWADRRAEVAVAWALYYFRSGYEPEPNAMWRKIALTQRLEPENERLEEIIAQIQAKREQR
jgi:hypothetical protein